MPTGWEVTIVREVESVNISKDGKLAFAAKDGPVLEKQLTPEDLQTVKQILQKYLVE